MKVVVLHPDLGIGGAERLIVDACMALRARGHCVTVYTNHFDPSHSFKEAREVLDVRAVGNWLPRSILGRCKAMCAYIRFIYAALYLALFVLPREQPDLLLVDLISAALPFLRLSLYRSRLLFYCHYPDRLLTDRRSLLKRLYRGPIDWLEEMSLMAADKILVNSDFTCRVFKKTFPKIKIIPDVCYPSINTNMFEETPVGEIERVVDVAPDSFILLSINRYERKKDLDLALKTLKALQTMVSEDEWKRIHLVMAGGYDPINRENIEHYEELTNLADDLDLVDKVTFLKSPSDENKVTLLNYASAVIYTPSNEHFGIVPLEAMYFGKPVIAVNSGGPTETIVHNVTGFLCESDEDSFAKAVRKLVTEPDSGKMMGEAGKNRFKMRFSFNAFTDQLDTIVKNLRRTADAPKFD